MKKAFTLILILAMLFCGAQALANVMVITGTTNYDDSEGMVQNLGRAMETLNGQKIEKGKSYSFNDIVGPRTEANGFTTALNGNGAAVLGGGVSQAATTLYLALKELGDDVVIEERHTFGSAFTAGYVEDVADTALTDYRHGLDLRFTCNTADDLVISMWDGGGTLFCQLTDASIVEVEPTETPGETPPETSSDNPSTADTSESTTDSEGVFYVVNVRTAVNLREEPSTTSAVLAEVPKGRAVKAIDEETEEFLPVDYEGTRGYIHTQYLSKDAPIEIWMKIVNCNSGVSLRKSPSTQAKKISDVALGETVRSLDHEDNGFIEVEYQGQQGYILKEYLEEIQE